MAINIPSLMQKISIELGDTNNFELIRGRRITRKNIYNNPGEIPVMSGHKEEDSYLGFISEKWLHKNNIPIYTEPLITINSNGNVGKVFLRNIPKYTFHDDVTGLKVINPKINQSYCLYTIREAIAKENFRYNAKLYIKRLKKIKIFFPLDEKGELDKDNQEELVIKFNRIETIKKYAKEQFLKLSNLFIIPSEEMFNFKFVELGNDDYFSINRGKRIRKKDIHKNFGNIPVISSSGQEDSYLGFISKNWLINNGHSIYNKPLITVNADGSVGDVFIRRETEYTIIDVVNLVELIDEKLYQIYIMYAIKEALANASYKYQAKLYIKRLKQVSIRIPINGKGEFDLDLQKQLAHEYEKLAEIKRTIAKFSKEMEDIFITPEYQTN